MATLSPLATELKQLLAHADWPLDASDLAAATGQRGTDTLSALEELRTAGLVTRHPGCRGAASWALTLAGRQTAAAP